MFPLSSPPDATAAPPPNDESPETALSRDFRADGARGTRTPDLLGAIQALSQLSYSPVGGRVQAFPLAP